MGGQPGVVSRRRFAVGLALALVLLTVWMALGVGILGRPGDLADSMYLGVIAVGIIGAMLARFRPAGMAIALLATALAQALVAVIVLINAMQQGPSAGTMSTLHRLFVALFLVSAWLSRSAREQTSHEVPPEVRRPPPWNGYPSTDGFFPRRPAARQPNAKRAPWTIGVEKALCSRVR